MSFKNGNVDISKIFSDLVIQTIMIQSILMCIVSSQNNYNKGILIWYNFQIIKNNLE